ncbi:hypothetical protein HK097_006999 [Rhizophlyctis rosea]|uniref:protein-tyrosine-phosphatase n=1 Tax=Rhizophlyctis rosea TaxID=64517 RepID=A0AAD5SEE6_9FUNG|nr:hypothetical protein HK097_006999 [Rhizophlyctis rosea]
MDEVNPLACSPEALIDCLHDRYMNVLLIDVSTSKTKASSNPLLTFNQVRTKRDVNLPGARHYEFIQEILNSTLPIPDSDLAPTTRSDKTLSISSIKGGLEFIVPAPSAPVLGPSGLPVSISDTQLLHTQWESVDEPSFARRAETDIIVCDDHGELGGPAARVAAALCLEGRCSSARFLEGGMANFAALYPSLVHLRNNGTAYPTASISATTDDTPSSPTSPLDFTPQLPVVNTITHSVGPFLTPTVQDLSSKQARLVNAVWYQGRGDTPLPIIPDFLYLGSCFAAKSSAMVDLSIKHVIRLGWGFGKPAGGEDIVCHDYPLEDSPEEKIGEWFEEVTGVIHRAGENGERVLVHCHAGVSRSATVVLAYLMKYRGVSLYDAWNIAYKSRPIIRPNTGFAMALQSLEKSLFNITTPTMPIYWMSDSYVNYLNYLEWKGRVETWKGIVGGGVELSSSPVQEKMEVDSTGVTKMEVDSSEGKENGSTATKEE